MKPNKVLDQLIIDLFHEDELGAVIRAHIRVESVLRNFVVDSAPNPKYINMLELDFDKTVTLAVVLGLNEGYEKSLRVLGKLRNDFAHKPDMKLSKNSVNNLYAQLTPEAKQFLQGSFKKLREENESIKPFQKFSDMPPAEQLKIIVVSIWAQVQSALLLLNEDKKA